jgi:hypothetical protein
MLATDFAAELKIINRGTHAQPRVRPLLNDTVRHSQFAALIVSNFVEAFVILANSPNHLELTHYSPTHGET